ncbi:MFS transporter [Viridibacillus arvi]|uniref:MFS transporter n=1 Tax=Viridibacillus arvi TaxID=263475 RepID=UPI003CFF1BDA
MNILKKYGLLLGGLGFSYLGNWIYLVALNLFILNLTGSAFAVAMIYIIGPIARIMTNLIAGSIIDRSNKRQIMITTDIVRGLLIFLIPFMDSIWLIYAVLFFSNVAGSFFGPSSTFYITKYVSQDERKRFNAILGIFNSGSFLIGPALAGVLIISVGINLTIWVNSVTFFVCALAIWFLPKLEKANKEKREPIKIKILKEDFLIIWSFIKNNRVFFNIYIIFQIMILMVYSLDSQEVTFIKQDLGFSDSLYGLLISIAGVGSVIGGIVAATLTKKISLKRYIGIGSILTTIFYTAFYASFNLQTAIISFIGLGFFMAFCNAGYGTFYQNNVPPELMGRFGSIASIFQSVIQILFTLLLGIFAEVFTLKLSAISFGIISIFLSFILYRIIFSKQSSIVVQG